MPPEDAATLGARLLDAQVAFHLARLTGDELPETVTRIATTILDSVGNHQIADLVDAEALKLVVERAMTDVPSSAAVAGFVELARELVRSGPTESFPLSQVVDREQVERILDEALQLTPAIERGLERLTASPLVGATATRFMGRVVGEALAANRAVADKVPGLGSLLSLGTRVASGAVGAADRQLDGLLAETAGKGGTLAVRRLNRIIVDTLRDPTTRDAAMQVWDLIAAAPVTGLTDHIDPQPASDVIPAVHDLAISVLGRPQALALGHAVVDGFLEAFGGYTPTELLAELDLDRHEVVADLCRFAPGVMGALADSGELERLLRAELSPFYQSDAVVQLLAERA